MKAAHRTLGSLRWITLLGIVPLALAGGQPGSEIEMPMAVVILCGLATSTPLKRS